MPLLAAPGAVCRWLLAGLEAVLPPEIGPAIVGDLLEEARDHSPAWLVRQVVLAAVLVPLGRAGRRRVAWTLGAGLLAGAVVWGLGLECWQLVLSAVPRRAAHAPGTGWRIAITIGAACAATLVAGIGRRAPTGRA